MKNSGILIKSLVLLIILYLLYNRIESMDWQLMAHQFSTDFASWRIYYLLFALFLMPINYWMEVKKWDSLTRSLFISDTRSSWRAVLSGLTLANSTPLRLGDYAGRVLHLPSKYIPKALIANFAASLVQNLVNLGVGISLLYFFLSISNNTPNAYLYIYFFSLLLSITLVLWIVLNVGFLKQQVKKVFFYKKIHIVLKQLKQFRNFSKHQIATVFYLSALRYLIYLIQYYLMLMFFGAELDLFSALIGIGVVYLIQTVLPLPALLGFVARAEIALVVWTAFSINPIIVLCASYGLWILNQLIPSIAGMIFLSQLRVPTMREFIRTLKKQV